MVDMAKEEPVLTLYNQVAAAAVLGQHAFTVRTAIRRGDIPVFARTTEGWPLVTLEALLAYQRRRLTDPRFAYALTREKNRMARLQNDSK